MNQPSSELTFPKAPIPKFFPRMNWPICTGACSMLVFAVALYSSRDSRQEAANNDVDVSGICQIARQGFFFVTSKVQDVMFLFPSENR